MHQTQIAIAQLLIPLAGFLLIACGGPKEPTLSPGVTQVGTAHGIRWGVATLPESAYSWNLGTGPHYYSTAVVAINAGYFYGNYQDTPGAPSIPVYFANVISNSPCTQSVPGIAMPNEPGYTGISSVTELTTAKIESLILDTTSAIEFGTRKSPCYTGLLVFRQDGYYGVIDPVEMDQSGTLLIHWWVGEQGVTDFSQAPVHPHQP